jgi:iron complex outermembrane recepter protein
MTERGMRVVVAVALGAIAVEGAGAQEATPGGAREVIIVTGVGPERSSDELITNTTALDASDIAERLDGGLGDTLAGLPGVSTTSFGPGASRPVIRGLGAERVQVLNNGIGVIDASAASPDHAVTADPLGAERIEILRGPAALAYGGGATGGVVNVIDALIAETPGESSADAYAGYTTVDEGTTLAARGSMAIGAATITLGASSRDGDTLEIPGYAESAQLRALEEAEGEEHEQVEGELENSFVQSSTLSAGLSFAGDAGFLGASVRRLDTQYGIVGGHGHGHSEEEGAPSEEEEEENPFIDLEQTRLDVRGGLNLGDGLLKRVTAAVSAVDYTHTEFEAPGVVGTLFESEGFEGRIELEHAHRDGFGGTAGLQVSRRDLDAQGEEAFITPTRTDQAGLFIFETWDNDRWGVEGGLRVDQVTLDNAIVGERDFTPVNVSFGAHVHASEALFLGLAVSRTERAPTDVELFADGPHAATRQFEIGDPELSTETGVTVEASARWEAGPLSLNASVYHYRFDDFIFLSPTGTEEDELPVFVTLQDEARFTGAEAGAAFDFGRIGGVALRADANVDVVRAELADGGDLPRIPPLSLAAGLEAEAGRFTGRLEARWADDQDDVAAFELPTDGYTVIDLRVVTQLVDGVDFILEGTNLTDEEVRVHASPLKDLAPQPGRGLRAALRASF